MHSIHKLEARVSLYRSPDKNKLICKCLHDMNCPPMMAMLDTFFPQGPMLKLCPLMVPILNIQSAQKNHTFCRGPFKDNPCNACFKLVKMVPEQKIFTHFSHRVLY